MRKHVLLYGLLNPIVNIALSFLEPLPVGIIFTLITAFTLSRKRKGEAEAVALA